jgi:hypothetical protein
MGSMIGDLIPMKSTVVERQDFGDGWFGEVSKDTYRNGRTNYRTTISFGVEDEQGSSAQGVLMEQFETLEEAAVALNEMLPKAFAEGLTVTTEGDATIIDGDDFHYEVRANSTTGWFGWKERQTIED